MRIKKAITSLLSAAILCSIIPQASAQKLEANVWEKGISCTEENSGAIYNAAQETQGDLGGARVTNDIADHTVTTREPNEKCIKVTAQYNLDGSLKNVVTEQINRSDIEPVKDTGLKKTFYWDSLEHMEPVENPGSLTWDHSFVFGTDTAPDGTVAVKNQDTYGKRDNNRTYGFLSLENSPDVSDGRTDGFRDAGSHVATVLKSGSVNGNTYVEADYSGYDGTTLSNMACGVMPIRFSVQAEQHRYYTVEATVVNTSPIEMAEVTLFSEKRHYILFQKQLAPGESITKTFNVNLESVYYNSGGLKEDDILNVCVMGKNAGLQSVKIKQHDTMGKTMWLCTDSTGCDQSSYLPYFPLRNYGGVGAALSKYLNPGLAISNQGEGGLEASDWDHFNNAVAHMNKGDYLYVQYGYNDSSPAVYKANLEKYYTAVQSKGVKLIIVSPTERRNPAVNWDSANGKWTATNAGFAAAGKEFVDQKLAKGADDIAFVDLQAAYLDWMNQTQQDILAQRQRLGFSDTAVNRLAMDYYYVCGWDTGVDTVHINDAGADHAAYLFAEQVKQTIAADPDGVQAKVLSELVENQSSEKPYTISDETVSKGWAPNVSYPYSSSEEVEYTYPTAVKNVDVKDGKLNSMSVKVQGDMDKYAKGVAEILDASGNKRTALYTKSTDINGSIGHIDNTAAQYGDVVTLYFDSNDPANILEEGDIYKVYMLPIDNGADVPDASPYYSSIYTPPAKVLSYLASGADGKSTEMFDYDAAEGTDVAGLGANTASGTNKWEYVGSSSGAKHHTAVKDGLTSAQLYNNGSGTFSLTKFFNGNTNVSKGKLHVRFQLHYSYGYFGIKLTSSSKAASWMDGISILNVADGAVTMYDGTNVGRLKRNKWTDIDVWIDLDRGTEAVSVAGDEPVTCGIEKLQTSDINDATSLIPVKGINFIYTANPSTIVSYPFEAYITDISVTSVETDTPKVTAALSVEESSTAMGTVAGSGVYDINSDITITATPNSGYSFKGWYTEDGRLYSSQRSLTIGRARSDISLIATFAVQKHKEDITSFEIGTDKAAVRAGSSVRLSPQNAQDQEGNDIDEVTAADIEWSCGEEGISISYEGVLNVTDNFLIGKNALKTITVTGQINGYKASAAVTIYSYAYYEVMSDKADFNGKIMDIANKAAVVWPGENQSWQHKLSEVVSLDKDTQIVYSNAWSGANAAGQNRYITFKDSAGSEVLKLYYSWMDLYTTDGKKLAGAVAKDTWSDISIKIAYDTGIVTVSNQSNAVEITVDQQKLTNIAAVELSSAKACPGPEARALGISSIVILQ